MSEPADRQPSLTFVVRLWREMNSCGHSHWCARVECVGTQEARYVRSVAEITDCIAQWVPLDEEQDESAD